jgi:hypothetical protein
MQLTASMLHINAATSKKHCQSIHITFVKLFLFNMGHSGSMTHIHINLIGKEILKICFSGLFTHNTFPF